MKKIDIKSHAKVNLSLDVLYKRSDNYHEIDTVMQQISLHDILSLENVSGKNIIIESNRKELPLDSSNLVYKAWEKIRVKTGIDRGIKIKIYKEIPIAAGLAGGSSNAAATLIGLNNLWDLKLSEEDLREIALEIGADVPYCLIGGTAHAKGIGEILSRVKSFKEKHLLLFNPGIEVSSAYVYNNLRPQESSRIDMEKIISFIENDDILSLARNMKNIMEKVVIDKYPVIGEAKREMKECGALGSLMSGSGSTVFGLFDDPDRLNYCKEKLKDKGRVVPCKTL